MRKKRFLVGLIIFIILVLSGIFYFLVFNKGPFVCNDGTGYNNCSKIKPYFCSERVLIENASVCGCSNLLEIDGEKCVSEYQTGSKDLSFNYVLDGKEGKIDFTVYRGLYNYLSELPRYIDSSENPTLLDFKLRKVNEEQQSGLLLPLVIKIENLAKDKTDQARIAISLVQNIPFGSSNKTIKIGNSVVEYSRYPYEVLYDEEGICSEKAELLVFLLREIGYGTAFLYYGEENHEAVGIKCPEKNSVDTSGYCFIETTGPSITTDDKTEYVGLEQLNSAPDVIIFSDGISLEKNLPEYGDAKNLIKIRDTMKNYGVINPFQSYIFKNIKKKYGLVSFNEYVF